MSEEIITSNHWLVVTNPTAGKRKFREQSKYVLSELEKADIRYLFKVTEYSGHAIEIAKKYAKLGCQNFLVLGGDGSISEVINGIFAANVEDTSKIKIALIPRGTGNDWGRFWKLRKNDKESMKVLLNGQSQLIDIGKIDYFVDGNTENHYFINSVGFGLDATVVDLTHRLKKYVGSFSLLYTFALLLAIFRYKSVSAKIKTSDKNLEISLFTMNVANGPYSGGGIKQNPAALPYDGILDTMVVEKPSLKDIFTALPLLFNGKLTKHSAIKSFQIKELKLNIEQRIYVEADGIIVRNAHNCTISIVPSAIKMIVP